MSRIYEINGKKYPSVTTILSLLNKPALVPWAAKMTAAAFKNAVVSNIDTLNLDLLDEIEIESKKIYRKKSEEAMSIGTRVHEIIEQWIQSDGKITPDEVSDPYAKKGLEAFLSWGEAREIEIVNNEVQVTDNKLFAGRYDLLAYVDGKLTLVDFKTSTGVWFEYWLQLGGYAIASDEPVEQIAVLRIDKETGELEYLAREVWIPYASAFQMLAQFYSMHAELEALEKGMKRGDKNSKHKDQ